MIVFLFLGLYTSRVTLNALGVHDYGLLSVIGGVMGFLGYFSRLLSEGTTRFVTIGLGKGNIDELRKIFSACSAIHIVLAIITLVIGETIGLWFVNNKLVIDPDRMYAANWIYQLTLFSSVLSITQTPYMAAIIAHEKMSTFAFMSIFDAAVKLIVVILLLYVDTDKLILYSTFQFFIGLLVFFMYRIYCLRKFEECTLKVQWDKQLYKDIWNYVGWNSLGAFAFICNGQGITIVLNMFFSTVVNAARGIAATVSGYVYGFVSNFLTAVKPQIMKYYAVGDYEKMNELIRNSAKYSSFLMLFIGLPVVFETEFLINLWLGKIPEYVIIFIRLTLLQLYFQSIDLPIGFGIHASGQMKLPNITSSFAYLSVLPITYIALKLGASPITGYLLSCIAFPLALCCDLWVMKKYSGFEIRDYIYDVILRSVFVVFFASLLPLFIVSFQSSTVSRFFLTCVISVISSFLSICFLGLDKSQRIRFLSFVKGKIKTKLFLFK